jgi:hypothetical protein
MATREKNQHTDILEQRYKGPNAVVSGLGYSALETKAGMVAGTIIGTASGLIFGEKVSHIEEALSKNIDKSIAHFTSYEGKERLLRKPLEWGLKFTQWSLHFADRSAHSILEILPEKMQTRLAKSPRYNASVKGAILGTFAGFVTASVFGLFHGAHVATRGRDQFEEARDEIHHLRHKNRVLEQEIDVMEREQATCLAKHRLGLPLSPSPHIQAQHAEHAGTVTPRQEKQLS